MAQDPLQIKRTPTQIQERLAMAREKAGTRALELAKQDTEWVEYQAWVQCITWMTQEEEPPDEAP